MFKRRESHQILCGLKSVPDTDKHEQIGTKTSKNGIGQPFVIILKTLILLLFNDPGWLPGGRKTAGSNPVTPTIWKLNNQINMFMDSCARQNLQILSRLSLACPYASCTASADDIRLRISRLIFIATLCSLSSLRCMPLRVISEEL